MNTKVLRLAIPPGTLDVFGAKMRLRQHALHTIESIYRQFGFELLSTPTIENEVVFDGHHGEGEKLLFHLNDGKKTPLVLRYDLTVPLARVMGMYPEIPRPFKRYQIASVFRDDKPDKGHFREFTQCDADVVGTSDLSVDAEVLIMAASGLDQIGLNSYVIRVNHRSILRAIGEYIFGYDCNILDFQRSLDFSDKVLKQGHDGIKVDLLKKGFAADSVDRLMPILDLKGDPLQVLEKVKTILIDHVSFGDGFNDLRKILQYLPQETYDKVKIDFTLARGADYYTGFILEGVLPDVPVGAVLGGGRYDNLIAAAGGKNEPAVGMAFGLDRIVTAMEYLSINIDDENSTLLLFGSEKKVAIARAQQLRGHGIAVDFNPDIKESSEAADYATNRNYSAFAECNGGGNIFVTSIKEGLHSFGQDLQKAISAVSKT